MDNNEKIFEMSAEDLEKITGGKTKEVQAIKSGVNIHDFPGEKQRVIGKTVAGAIAKYAGEMVYIEGKPWVKIRYNGTSGWILAKYVRII